MKRQPTTWRSHIAAAEQLVELAHTYKEDGAYLTAAARLEEAAAKLRLGYRTRQTELGGI